MATGKGRWYPFIDCLIFAVIRKVVSCRLSPQFTPSALSAIRRSSCETLMCIMLTTIPIGAIARLISTICRSFIPVSMKWIPSCSIVQYATYTGSSWVSSPQKPAPKSIALILIASKFPSTALCGILRVHRHYLCIPGTPKGLENGARVMDHQVIGRYVSSSPPSWFSSPLHLPGTIPISTRLVGPLVNTWCSSVGVELSRQCNASSLGTGDWERFDITITTYPLQSINRGVNVQRLEADFPRTYESGDGDGQVTSYESHHRFW